MKRIIIQILLATSALFAQQTDSINSYQLKEIIVIGKSKTDGLPIDYFKVNTPATTEEILARSQSINMIRRGNYGLEPTIRGFSSGQINLTIDGMHIQCACTDKMDPVTIYIEPQNLSNIEILPSSKGLQFGSTVGGSINMTLANPIFSKDFLKSSIGYQSVSNSFNGNFSINKGWNNFSMLLNGSYRKSDNYRDGSGKIVPFSYYKKVNYSMAMNYLLSENEELKLNLLFDDGWDIGYPALPMDVGYAKARIYSLSYNVSEFSKLINSLEGKLYFNSIDHFMDDTKRPSVSMHMDMPGWSNTLGSYIETKLNTGNYHNTKLYLDIYRTFVRAEMTMYPPNAEPMFMLTLPDTRRWSTSFFVSDDWSISKTFIVSSNVKFENLNSLVISKFGRQQFDVFNYSTEKSKNIFLKNGSLNFTKNLNSGTDLSLMFGFGERLASFNEAYGFYLFNSFDGYDYIGNPELETEKSFNSEMSLHFYSSKINIKATAFYNHLNDYMIGNIDQTLSPMTIGAKGVKIFSNIPYATMFGSEFNIKLFPSNRFNSITTLKYQVGKDNNSNPLILIPPFKIISILNYQFKYLGLQAELEYSAHQSKVRISVGEKETPEYILFHFRTSYQLPMDSFSILFNCGIENIFDIAYKDHLDWGNILRQGRNIYLSISFTN